MTELDPGAARQLLARLERLPLTPALWFLVCVAGGAWFVESLDIGAISVVLPVLTPLWHLTPGQEGLLATASTIGIVVGLIPAGRLADRYGRVNVLVWGMTAFGTLTLLSALAPGFVALLLLRFLAGLGMGAVFPLPYAIVAEFVRKNRRTWLSGFLDAMLSVGYFVAPLLGLLIVPALPAVLAWRVFLVVAGAPIVYALFVRRNLPESPRWLLEHGRAAEAEAVVARLEAQTATYVALEPPVQADVPPPTPARRVPCSRLVGRTILGAAAATGTFFMFYVVMTYTPTIFAAEGFSIAKSLAFAALVTACAIPGKLLNGHLSETIGRKPVFLGFMGAAAVTALLFGWLRNPLALLGDAMLMSFFGTGAFPGLKMYYAELFPTAARVTGAAAVESVARTLGGIVGAAFMPLAWHHWGIPVAFDIIGAAAFASLAVLGLWGTETRGLTLEAVQDRLERRHRPAAAHGIHG
jgi:putative MFS transporter